MLGTQLGKKVDANFMRDQYQEFLIKNKNAKPPINPLPKPMTKLQKRAEMRKRGIFVEADNTENDYSFMEKPKSEMRPYVCRLRTSKLKWKTTDSDGSSGKGKREKKGSRRRRKRSKSKAKRRRSSSISTELEPGTISSIPGAAQPAQPGGEAGASTMLTPSMAMAPGVVQSGSEVTPSAMMTPSMAMAPGSAQPGSEVTPSAMLTPAMSMDPDSTQPGSTRLTPSVVAGPTEQAPSTMGAPSEPARPEGEAAASTMQAPSTMAPLEQSLSLDVTQKGEGGAVGSRRHSTKRSFCIGPSNETAIAERAEEILEKVTQEDSVRPVKKKEAKKPPSQRKPLSKELADTQPDEEEEEKTKSYFGPDVKVDTLKVKEGEHKPGESSEATISTRGAVTGEAKSQGDELRSARDDVFSALEEDVDLTKCLGDFDTESVEGVGASDRKTLESAKKILRIAHKEKAIEKTLTKEENEVVSKFFAGKIPYDQNVLNVLDRVLDKTIDYLQTHGANLDAETKRLIEKRKALKAAMLETMLTTPKFIPTTWVQHYDRLHKQAMQETSGINWAKVLLFYPRQRSFDDGEADIFGNFTRHRSKHWIIGCILGPNDSKTFEETERERQSKGLFMDTSIMEHAKNEGPLTTTTMNTTTLSTRSDMELLSTTAPATKV
ncbi:hypothetical protein ANCCAN_08103 [Ancylostoma caninum]|uniref:DUF7774 domain-containing protein n=1 Tax=Ancylostoma caninum TaxID=29170 RepID=A0A368GQS1_ANCCA|nr:hypothetical protein ANCCAN_08103 [Ancylostoma caninum]